MSEKSLLSIVDDTIVEEEESKHSITVHPFAPRLMAEDKKVIWQYSVTLRYQLIEHERDKIVEIRLWNKSQSIEPLLLDKELFEKKYDQTIKEHVEARLLKPKYLSKNPVFGMEMCAIALRKDVINDLIVLIVGKELSIKGDLDDGQELKAVLSEDILYTQPILLLPYVDKRKDINISRSFYDAFATLRRSSVGEDLPQSLRSSAFFCPFDPVQYRRDNIRRIFQRVYRKVVWMNQVKRTKEKLRRIETAKLMVKRRANGWKQKAAQRDRDIARSRHTVDAVPTEAQQPQPQPSPSPSQQQPSLSSQPSQKVSQRRSLPHIPSEKMSSREEVKKNSDVVSLPRIQSKESGLNRLNISNRGGTRSVRNSASSSSLSTMTSPVKTIQTTTEKKNGSGASTAMSSPILSPMSSPILSPMPSPPQSRRQSNSSNCLLLMTDETKASKSSETSVTLSFLLSASTGQIERGRRTSIFSLPTISY